MRNDRERVFGYQFDDFIFTFFTNPGTHSFKVLVQEKGKENITYKDVRSFLKEYILLVGVMDTSIVQLKLMGFVTDDLLIEIYKDNR
jgi:hypothetical protein